MRRIGIIGAGAWGTALAAMLAGVGHEVEIWAREPEVAEAIAHDHENKQFLPGVALPPTLRAGTDLGVTVAAAEALLIAVPAQHLRGVLS
ncbi:MAG: NAD(P)-binding domain-containing protein, partial [Stellaceae bacterium]